MNTLENKIRIQNLLSEFETVDEPLTRLKKFKFKVGKEDFENYTEEQILQYYKDLVISLKCKSFVNWLGKKYANHKFCSIKCELIKQLIKEIDFDFKIGMIIEYTLLQTYRLWVIYMILRYTREGAITYDMLKSMSIDEMEEYHDKLLEEQEKKEKENTKKEEKKKGWLDFFF